MSAGGEEEREPTVGEFLRGVWLPAAGVTIRPTTRSSYKTVVEAHLGPAFDGVPLTKLRPPAINAFYQRLLTGGEERRALVSGTVRRLHAVFHRAMRDAVRWGYLRENPVAGWKERPIHAPSRVER